MAFLDSLWPAILKASQATGLDPRLIASQAALESNWGKSAPGNNLFGIKGGSGPALATTEVVNGQPVQTTAQFRGYSSPADSVMGYADFINSNKRYGPVKAAQGLDAQIAAMGQSGYATDPNYAAKLRSIAATIQAPGTPSPSSPAGGALAASGMQAPTAPPSTPVPDNAGIPTDVAAYATSSDNQKSPLQRLGEALAKYPNAPQAQTGGGGGAPNGSALLQYLQRPRALAEMLLRQRLGQG